jgi:hypothetical protein
MLAFIFVSMGTAKHEKENKKRREFVLPLQGLETPAAKERNSALNFWLSELFSIHTT